MGFSICLSYIYHSSHIKLLWKIPDYILGLLDQYDHSSGGGGGSLSYNVMQSFQLLKFGLDFYCGSTSTPAVVVSRMYSNEFRRPFCFRFKVLENLKLHELKISKTQDLTKSQEDKNKTNLKFAENVKTRWFNLVPSEPGLDRLNQCAVERNIIV